MSKRQVVDCDLCGQKEVGESQELPIATKVGGRTLDFCPNCMPKATAALWKLASANVEVGEDMLNVLPSLK